jgi:hypothetical protein
MRGALCAFAALAGCTPPLGAPASQVQGTQLLAIKGEPAEAAPGAMVRWTSLVASPAGTVDSPGLLWTFCLDPKPLAENNAIAASCLGDGESAGGPAPSLDAALPKSGCELFGPNTPPTKPGEPPLRPRDPDVTGGYYQPLVVDLPAALDSGGDLLGVALQRISCDLANAPVDVVRDYGMRYTANQNPQLAEVDGALDGAELAPVATLGAVPAGAHVQLEARFTDGAAETFPVYDPASRALSDQREALRVSWFASGGTFDHDVTGRGADETEPFADNGWSAPGAAGPVTLWAVLRDSRGGVDFAAFTWMVE